VQQKPTYPRCDEYKQNAYRASEAFRKAFQAEAHSIDDPHRYKPAGNEEEEGTELHVDRL